MLSFLCGSITCVNNKCLTEQHSHFGHVTDKKKQSSASHECLSKFARLLHGLPQSELITVAYSTAYLSQAMNDYNNELVCNGMLWYIFIVICPGHHTMTSIMWHCNMAEHQCYVELDNIPFHYILIQSIFLSTHTTLEYYIMWTKL